MIIFTTLIDIDFRLQDFFKEIERYFAIKLNKDTIDKIFKDAEDDQVSKKQYLLYQAENKLLRKQLIIQGTVDEYEPETIWIEIQNIKQKDLKHFNEVVSS